MRDWEYQQQQDEQQRMERAEQIIRATEHRPLTENERISLAVEVGLGNMYRKQLATERK